MVQNCSQAQYFNWILVNFRVLLHWLIPATSASSLSSVSSTLQDRALTSQQLPPEALRLDWAKSYRTLEQNR